MSRPAGSAGGALLACPPTCGVRWFRGAFRQLDATGPGSGAIAL